MLKKQKYIYEFAEIGDDSDIPEEHLEILQKFICDVYGHKGDRVNLLRYKLYSITQGKLEAKSILPCFDRLQLHSRRAAYLSYIRRKCLVAKSEIPTPIGNGWELDYNDLICIKWNN